MRGKRMVAAALLAAVGGCGESVERAEGVPIERVPTEIMKVARENLPGIKFNLARKIKVKGQEAYEIQGQDQRGKVREVEVSTAGKVLEIE